jgi:hypothetical protein
MKTKTYALLVMLLIILPALGAAVFLTEKSRTGIYGIVYDAETKRPVAGARILIDGNDHVALTDENGEFDIINVMPGKRTVRAVVFYYNPSDPIAEVSVSIGKKKQLDIELFPTEPRAQLQMNISNERNQPVENAKVAVIDLGTFTEIHTASTDVAGNADIEDMRQGEYALRITHPEYLSEIAFARLDPDRGRLVYSLAPVNSRRTVLSEIEQLGPSVSDSERLDLRMSGTMVRGNCRGTKDISRGRKGLVYLAGIEPFSHINSATVFMDNEGKFSYSAHLPKEPKEYLLIALATCDNERYADSSILSVNARRIHMTEDMSRHEYVILAAQDISAPCPGLLERACVAGSINGIARDEQTGERIADAHVMITHERGLYRELKTTNNRGLFRSDRMLAGGSYAVTINAPCYIPTQEYVALHVLQPEMIKTFPLTKITDCT